METLWREMIWKQFGGAIDTLDNAVKACPDSLWRELIWHDPSAPQARSEFWYVTYHTLFWIDVYLYGTEEGFAPPQPFSLVEQDDAIGPLPDRVYSKDELRGYLAALRQKLRVTLATLTDERARQPVSFGWMEEGEVVTYVELQLYTMRHVQDHAAQLCLLLGEHGVPADQLDWVTRAKDGLDG